MSKIKKITAVNMAAVILVMSLTACGSNDMENIPDEQDASENAVSETPDEPISEPETYEDYMKLSDTYLQTDDVLQALAVLDEGIEKLSIGGQGVDLLSQRKEYILAGTVAVRTKYVENEYDEEGEILPVCILECDKNGNEIKSVYYDAEGEISDVEEYQYDDNGNRTEFKKVYKNKFDVSSHSYSEHWTWTYDENGNLIEVIEHDESGNIVEKTEHEYDTDGNLIKTTWYDKDDEIEGWAETEYDAAGNETKYERYNENGSCSRRIIQDYDEYGKQTQYIVYDGEGNITKKEDREYDKNGNEVKYVSYDDAITIDCWYETEYDESGKQIKFVCYDSEGGISYVWEYGYDDNGREIYESIGDDDMVIMWEYEYDEHGNQMRKILTSYDRETEQKDKEIEEYTYDENGNMTEYDRTYYEENEARNLRWERKYNEDGRETNFYFYDNEKNVSYQSETEYDENGLPINYTGYDKNGDDFVRRETEYDQSGKVIRENYYDKHNNLIQYYENEYDEFGNVTRQTMYGDDILKYEKQMSYTYRYIGNIDAEATDYVDKEVTPEEYNLQQRDIFIRFLNGQEKIRYRSNVNCMGEGKIIGETITDLIDFEYVKQEKYIRHYKRALEYAFLDMTGDGIEELLISCGGERLCVIQCSYGTLKVIHDIEESDFNTYLAKCNGRTGICYEPYIPLGDWKGCYFLDKEGKKAIFLDISQDEYVGWTKYRMSDSDSFEECDISKGEYYDVMGRMVTRMDIDWQRLEEPSK